MESKDLVLWFLEKCCSTQPDSTQPKRHLLVAPPRLANWPGLALARRRWSNGATWASTLHVLRLSTSHLVDATDGSILRKKAVDGDRSRGLKTQRRREL